MTPTDGAQTLPPPVRLTRFGPLTIAYDDRVLEPRPWTVMQSAWAAQLLADLPPGDVLELCSGAGHIGLLALDGTDRRLVLVDENPTACRYARVNADLARGPGAVEIREGRMADALEPDERYALVIADPPWVPTSQVAGHPDDPVTAIDGGPDGLGLVRTCVDLIGRHLADGGAAILQVGPDQTRTVASYVAASPALRLRVVEERLLEQGGLVHLARVG
ncbi:MAG TPA: class I SAM-dependent methyltransferase [Marmoricola sp.]|nr:class I SAM-dependent methyltransferase [Marmoricola sp.]